MIKRGQSWWGWWQKKYFPLPEHAEVSLGGFTTEITARGRTQAFGAEALNGFATEVIAYSGSQVRLKGFTTTVEISGTMDVYGQARLSGFNTQITAHGFNGQVGYVQLGKPLTELSAYGGAQATLGSFTYSVESSGFNGATASVNLGGFNSTLEASARALDYGVAVLRPPEISTLWGVAELSGFNTTILARSHLVASSAAVYAMTISSAETTQYTNYDFQYIVRFNGLYYGVRSDGLYLLEGSTDNGDPISAKFKTSMMDFGTALHKRVPYMYIDTEYNTQVTPYAEGVATSTFEAAHDGRRVRLARGPRGRFWEFEVTNLGGNEMKVGSLEAYAQVLTRKV